MLRKINHTVSKHLTAFSVFLLIGLGVFAQDITVKGKVTDKSTGSGLASATILSEEDMKGTLSDENGNFELVLPRKATLKIRVTYIGYDTSFVTIQTQAGKSSYTENIELMEEGVMGEEVVITAGRHEQKLADVPVSMDVIKPMAIDVQATSNIEDVLQQSPGVDIMDGQPNIRGSSGFAYGVGSRVLLMMDGLPLLSGESGTAMFDVIPVDNITQIEIMKGAASVLYGSSAMGGVINVITGDAPDKPKTSVRLRGTVFDMPSNKRLDWDGPYSSPYIASLNVFHSRRIKGQDLTILLDGTKDSGYRESTDRTQFRAVVMTKFRPKKVPGLTLGVNSSFKRDTSGAFLYWDSYEPGYYPSNSNPLDSVYSKGAYSGSGSARRQLLYRVTADPFVKYLTPKGNMHNYRGRVLWTKNINDTQQGSTSNMIFNDYQYSTKIWKKRLSWVSGASFIYNNTVAPDLFGNITDTTLADTIPIDDGKHFSLNGAIYSQ